MSNKFKSKLEEHSADEESPAFGILSRAALMIPACVVKEFDREQSKLRIGAFMYADMQWHMGVKGTELEDASPSQITSHASMYFLDLEESYAQWRQAIRLDMLEEIDTLIGYVLDEVQAMKFKMDNITQ